MQKSALDGVFKAQKLSPAAKGDATTRAAREIIARETAERDAKTARLRALRLAREQEEAASAVPPVAAEKPAKKASEGAPKKTRKARVSV
jgi:hypothetical protein